MPHAIQRTCRGVSNVAELEHGAITLEERQAAVEQVVLRSLLLLRFTSGKVLALLALKDLL